MPKIKNVFKWVRWIPDEYQPVEYIESSGTQWINTGVTATQNTKSQIKVRPLWVTWATIYWYCANNDNADYRLFNYSSQIYWDLSSYRAIWSTFSSWTDYEFEIWNNYVKNVGASSNLVTWTTVSSYTSAWTIKLNYHDDSWAVSSNRRYYVKIWDWATQVRDLVPCYRKSDSVIWMYDLVWQQFYTNQWTWTFTKGSDTSGLIQKQIYPGRLPSDYQEVEYIENTWTSYINTGYIPTVDTEIETDISWWSQTETRWVFRWVTGNDRSSDWILWRIYNWYADRYNPRFCNTTYDATIITWMTLNTFRKIILKKNWWSVDWVAYTIDTNSTPYQSAMDIFAWNNWWSHWRRGWQCKIKTFKISEWWVLIRNFIPCYRKSDNVIWMYDSVWQQFYTNSWSWTFTKWPNV